AFGKALELAGAEESVEAWGRMASRWADDLIPSQYKTAARRAADVQAYLVRHPRSPLAAPARNYLAYLREGLLAAAPNGFLKKSLYELLLNPLVHDLQTVETVHGQRYYALAGKLDLHTSRIGP